MFAWNELQFQTQNIDLASQAEESVVQKIEMLNKAVGTLSPKEDMSCMCTLGNSKNIISFENPEECGAERNYLQKSLADFKNLDPEGYYTQSRGHELSEVLPRKCTVFIMRKFWKDRALKPFEKHEAAVAWNRTASPDNQRTVKPISEYKEDPHLFSKCEEGTSGVPERYPHKACVTEDYVNLVHNSLLDVADCMNVPAKFIAPKLSNESGLHLNAFGLVNDGGIGQFTNQALVDVAQNFDFFKNQMNKNSKESCQRIKSIPGAIPRSAKEILAADEERCHVITSPPNPLRSLFYYGIFYHATKRNAEQAFNRTADSKDSNFQGMSPLIEAAGLSPSDVERFKEILFVLAYNIGPGRPAVAFREWLKYRIETIHQYPITKAELNEPFWPTDEQRAKTVGTERVLALKKKGKPLNFVEYLFALKNSLYVPAVQSQAKMLKKNMGEGVCTEEKFLEF